MKHRFFYAYVVSAGRLVQHERSKRIGDDLYGFLPLDLYGSRGDTDEFVSWLDAYRVADWFGEHTPDEKAEEAIAPLRRVKENDNPVLVLIGTKR